MTIYIRNWEKFQHRDAGRTGNIPWIRNYTQLLSDDAYTNLSGHRRAVLHGLWLEYARSRRQLTDDTRTLTRRLDLKVTTADLQALNHAGFIEILPAENKHDAGLEESRRDVPTNVGTQPQAKQARLIDPLWDALIDAMGRHPGTVLERRRWNAALKQFRDAGASPAEIVARAGEYRRAWPGVELTPHGLAANWSRFAGNVVSLRPFECPVCGVGHSTDRKLAEHLVNVHDVEAVS